MQGVKLPDPLVSSEIEPVGKFGAVEFVSVTSTVQRAALPTTTGEGVHDTEVPVASMKTM